MGLGHFGWNDSEFSFLCDGEFGLVRFGGE